MTAPERRVARRFNVTFRLVCDDGQGYGGATVVNLSESGALVQSSRAYELGDEITLVPIGSAGEILFDVPGTIVRVVASDGSAGVHRYGLHFHDVSQQQQAALRLLCRAMPCTPEDLDEEHPEGGPRAEGGSAHHRIRTRLRDAGASPRWSRRPF